MKRWVAVLPLVVLGLLAVLFAGYGLRHDPKVVPAALVGKPMPAFALPPLAGGAGNRALGGGERRIAGDRRGVLHLQGPGRKPVDGGGRAACTKELAACATKSPKATRRH